MSALATVIATFLVGPFQFAPTDVPKNHWAYPAVDRMFQEGLLKGYPSGKRPVLRLDKTAKLSDKETTALRDKWTKQELLYDQWSHGRSREPSRYELAVEIHATWVTVRDVLKSPKEREDKKRTALGEMPTLARAISAYNFELTKLGGDTGNMIDTLNDLLDARDRLFLGARSQ
jgi:hypothetical protein